MDRFKRMGLAALVVLPLFGGCYAEMVPGPTAPDQQQDDGDDDPNMTINVSDFGSGEIT